MKASVLLVAVAITSIPATISQSGSFAVGIVRIDGRLVPVGKYHSGSWESAWPEANRSLDTGDSIDAVPSIWRNLGTGVPRKWYVWPTSGEMITASVTGVDIVDAHCSKQVALRTDIRTHRTQDPHEHPHKFGVAVDSAIPVRTVEEVANGSASWNTALGVVLESFDRLESDQARVERRGPIRETPEPRGRITHLFREAKSPRSPMYFIAEKQYQARHTDPGCAVVTVMTGWLVPADDDSLGLIAPAIFLTDCDRKIAQTALPLGALSVDGRNYWVIQEHGYENETYVIAQIDRQRVRYRVTVDGGGC